METEQQQQMSASALIDEQMGKPFLTSLTFVLPVLMPVFLFPTLVGESYLYRCCVEDGALRRFQRKTKGERQRKVQEESGSYTTPPPRFLQLFTGKKLDCVSRLVSC